MDDVGQEYPWIGTRDERFTLALVLDGGRCSAGTATGRQPGPRSSI